MSVPAGVETDHQPPMTIPLRHFLAANMVLVIAVLAAVAAVLGRLPGVTAAVGAHLALAGWVCLTIAGALTQFVPVWSGVSLYSRRLAWVQLPLLVAGLTALILGLATVRPELLVTGGAVLLLGFWTMCYNVGRTLWRGRPWDYTERHFALALGYFLLVTTLGFTLAGSFAVPVEFPFGIDRGGVRAAHATLAVFGAVLTTIFGALSQLASMFTQTETTRLDGVLERIEEVCYPVGVLGLAGGRLFGEPAVARVGGLLVLLGIVAVLCHLARRLLAARVAFSSTLRRYAVVVPAGLLWAVTTLPVWWATPLAPSATLGAPTTVPLLVGGVVGFVVVGTLYHVVPFVVWVHEYSDRLGLEAVPSLDDLTDDRLTRVEFLAFVTALGAVTVAGVVAETGGGSVVGVARLDRTLRLLAVTLFGLGTTAFVGNLTAVLVGHSPLSARELLVGSGRTAE
jgi:hypothetical protein